MYLNYFRLREEPFGVTPDPRFLLRTAGYREALASLQYGIETGRGFMALIAPPGMGKTTLLVELLDWMRGRAQTAFLFQTQCRSRELLRALIGELGGETQGSDLVQLHNTLQEILLREFENGGAPVVVIDEAQNLEDSALETVRLLSDFETPRAKLVQIILSGQLELADKLAAPSLAQLRQRISIRTRLTALCPDEVRSYIERRLQVAGYQGTPLFTDEAYERVFRIGGGVPRKINNICFNALSLACALDRPQVDAVMLDEVEADLDWRSVASDIGRDRRITGAPSSGTKRATEPGRASQSPPVLFEPAESDDMSDSVEAADVPDGHPRADRERHSRFAKTARFPCSVEPRLSPRARAIIKLALIFAGAAILLVATILGSARLLAGPNSGRLRGQASAVLNYVKYGADGPPSKSQADAAQPQEAGADTGNGRPVPNSSGNRRTSSPAIKVTEHASSMAMYPAEASDSRLRHVAAESPIAASTSNGHNNEAQAPATQQPVRAGAAPGSSFTPAPPPATTRTALSAGVSPPAASNVVSQPVLLSALPQDPALDVQPAAVPPTPAAEKVGAGALLESVQPVYPEAARQAAIQGQVRLLALVGTDGRVLRVRVVNGSALLAQAAVEAVKQWRYGASYMNGEPIEVERQITLDFRLPR